MALKIYPINFGNMLLDSSGLVLFREPGKQVSSTLISLIERIANTARNNSGQCIKLAFQQRRDRG